MEIPSIIFIVVGILIGVVSYFSRMYYFIIAAVGFIGWGFFKIFKRKTSKSILEPDKLSLKEEKPYYQNDYKAKNTIPCPSCGLRHYSNANYCQNCGTKLK